jgi:hypothetical protein
MAKITYTVAVMFTLVTLSVGLPLDYHGASEVRASGYGQKSTNSLHEDRIIYYLPYVAKSWWESTPDVDWQVVKLYDMGGELYADFAMGGWLVRGKALQNSGPLWIMPYVGQICYWQGYYFFGPSTSWHPPFYIQFSAQEILIWPDSFLLPDHTPTVIPTQNIDISPSGLFLALV